MRRLYKDRNDRMIFGVAGGMAKYLQLDPVLVRVLFIVFSFMAWGLIAYLLLAIMTPFEDAPGQTAADTVRKNVEEITTEARDVVRGAGKAASSPEKAQRPAAAAGVFLILIGGVLLAATLGEFALRFLLRLWPVALIVLGVVLLLAPRRRGS